jgi:hypothetical protein
MSTPGVEDTALIERELGSALRSFFGPVICEPLPDQIRALLDKLAAIEARCGMDKRGGASAASHSNRENLRQRFFII